MAEYENNDCLLIVILENIEKEHNKVLCFF